MIRERARRRSDAQCGRAARYLAGAAGLVLLITPPLSFGADAGPMQVTIKNLKFMPAEVSVPVGTTVAWVNDDDEPHTITAQQKQFKSKPLDKNDTFSFTFDKPGEYLYFCSILATDGVEQVELTEPVKALKQASAEVHVVAPKEGEIQGFNHHERGDRIPVDVPLQQADPNTYDALVLPGGVINPDQLRLSPEAIEFVRAFARAGKPIAAICHGPWTLIDAGAVQGRRLTSWPSLQNDLRNAGAEWVDAPVVTDQGLVTSRKPDDIPDFCRKMIEEFAEGRHQRAAE